MLVLVENNVREYNRPTLKLARRSHLQSVFGRIMQNSKINDKNIYFVSLTAKLIYFQKDVSNGNFLSRVRYKEAARGPVPNSSKTYTKAICFAKYIPTFVKLKNRQYFIVVTTPKFQGGKFTGFACKKCSFVHIPSYIWRCWGMRQKNK